MKYPLIQVEWDDHLGDHAWVHENDVKNKPIACVSVGWLFVQDKKCLTLIGAISETGVGNYQTILRSCITKLKVLKKAEK